MGRIPFPGCLRCALLPRPAGHEPSGHVSGVPTAVYETLKRISGAEQGALSVLLPPACVAVPSRRIRDVPAGSA